MRLQTFKIVLAVLCVIGLIQSVQSAEKPNIVIFFTDDTGYCDIGPFGGLTPTPNLDRMASEGIKLTSFYVSSVKCSPSRAALMTGCYASRVNMNGAVTHAGFNWGLHPDEVTMAEMLKEAGYATGCFGKWHLGDQPGLMPNDQGFDLYEGIPYSNDMWDYLYRKKNEKLIASGQQPKGKKPAPLPWMKNDKAVAWIDGPLSQALMNDAIADATVNFIDTHKDRPFFAYVPFPSTHNPTYALKERGDKIAALGCPEKSVHKYAQIAEIDACVGRVMNALARHGLHKNTLLFYTNDNGGPSSFYKKGTLVPRGGKFGPPYEGNMRMSTLAWWPGKIPSGYVCDEIATSTDLFPTLAKIAGGKIPQDRVIDGKDLSGLLFNKGASPHQYFCFGGKGIRQGKWKLIPGKETDELFDLQTDYVESTNVSSQHPEIVEGLKKALAEHNADLRENQRPRGEMKTEGPILEDASGIPTLAKYLNRENEQIYSGKEK